MIEVFVYKAFETMVKNNNTFLEDELYFGRLSRNENSIVVRSEEGHWIPFVEFNFYNYQKLSEFSKEKTIYMRNRKRINEFESVEEYLNGDNYHQWFYGSVLRDNKLGRWH